MYVRTEADNKVIINRMINIIKDELNIKEIVFLDDFNSLKKRYLTLNFRNAGTELKENLKDVKKLLEECTNYEMSQLVNQFDSGSMIKIPKWDKALENKLFLEKTVYNENFVVGRDGDTEIALLLTLNEELVIEGLYRELLRQCQLLRKEAGLRVEQRIVIGIKSDSTRIDEVIKRYYKNICEEVLTLDIVESIDCPLITEEVQIDERLTILQLAIAQ